MLRWIVIPLGLAAALAAGWLLLTSTPEDPTLPPPREAAPDRAPRGAAPGEGAARDPSGGTPDDAPEGHIDEASRRELERVLEREGVEP